MEGTCSLSGSDLHSFGIAENCSARPFQPFHKQGTVGLSLGCRCQVLGLDFPNHVKIDVDGLEEKIVVDAAQTLEDRRFKSVLV